MRLLQTLKQPHFNNHFASKLTHTMLSILIPTYNYDCSRLINDLWLQCTTSGIDFEILVCDDGSTQEYSKSLSAINLPNYTFEALTNNIGRAKIRNRLAHKAQGKWLLFIDCDAEINDSQFINNYKKNLQDNTVLVGGTAYYPHNDNPNHSLRWTYGTEREGNNNYKKNFTTFNFAIQQHIFLNIQFDETLTQYGHEDTVFQIMLERNNITIKFIDNPLVHCGLDDNKIYLEKIKTSNNNLLALYQSGKYPELQQHSKLLNTYLKLKQKHFTLLFNLFYKIIKPLIIKNLTSTKPKIKLLDIYKLGELCA